MFLGIKVAPNQKSDLGRALTGKYTMACQARI